MNKNKLYLLSSIVLLLLLGSSILINLLLYSQAKKYYFELNETRLDPLGMTYYPPNFSQTDKPNPLRIVFFGDSRAASWIAPDLSGYEFINRGIVSQTSVQAIARFSAHVQPLKPNIVVLQVGINDLKTIALFPERRDAIVANTKANIKQIVEASRKLGSTVIITTVFPVGDVPLIRKPFWSDAIQLALQEVNTYIATLATEKVMVFDTVPLLANPQGGMLPQYSLDELHLNESGYARLNQELIKQIQSFQLTN